MSTVRGMRRAIWVFMAVVVLVAGCGSDDGSDVRTGSPDTAPVLKVDEVTPGGPVDDSDAVPVEPDEVALPVLERHAVDRPWIDVDRVRNLVELHGNADRRFQDAQKADGLVHLLSIWDVSLEQVGALLDEAMVEWRVVQRDCEGLPVTEDWWPGRANLYLVDEMVVGWEVEDADHSHGSTWCASDTEDTDPRYGILGRELSEAAAILDEQDVIWRLTGRDCEPLPMTMDLRPGRVNLATFNDVVYRYSIEAWEGPDNVYELELQPTCPEPSDTWPEGEVIMTALFDGPVRYIEGGGYDFLPFSLTEIPVVPVIVRFEALDPTEVALSDQAIVEIEVTADNYEMFGPNWRAPQDGIDDGDQTTQVRVSVIADPSDPIFRDTTDLMVTVITVDRAPSIDDH